MIDIPALTPKQYTIMLDIFTLMPVCTQAVPTPDNPQYEEHHKKCEEELKNMNYFVSLGLLDDITEQNKEQVMELEKNHNVTARIYSITEVGRQFMKHSLGSLPVN
jgi:uncharacterized membrane protein YgaE (UPF0421/DUF939 family)